MDSQGIMETEPHPANNTVKGYMFEVIVSLLLEKHDFKRVYDQSTTNNGYHVEQARYQFTEFTGRGTKHQIDCPYDYPNTIPFINQIRLLGEVKCYGSPIRKEHIRTFIGTIKDITENYVTNNAEVSNYKRYTELGVIFSASGFDIEAERLALAHNIKTVSYENHCILGALVSYLNELEIYRNKQALMGQGKTKEFLMRFKSILSNDFQNNDIQSFRRTYYKDESCIEILKKMQELLGKVKSNFLAVTKNGLLIHFISFDPFPYDVFTKSDTANCSVFYESNEGRLEFYLDIDNNENVSKAKYYFSPPEILEETIRTSPDSAVSIKRQLFEDITFSYRINDINRTLTLKLNFGDFPKKRRIKAREKKTYQTSIDGRNRS